MKSSFKYYVVCWFVLFVLFNVIIFVLPNEWYGFDKYGGAFWGSYIFMSVAFLGHLFCAWIAFKADNLRRLFYRIPLITISYGALTLTLIAGAICFAIPNLPNWVAIIVCSIILAFNVIAVVGAKGTGDAISGIDDKMKVQISFVKTLTVEAENLVKQAKSEDARQEAKKVYELIRYSDPMSNEVLSDDEIKISKKFKEIAQAISEEDDEILKHVVEDFVVLVEARNRKCKMLK